MPSSYGGRSWTRSQQEQVQHRRNVAPLNSTAANTEQYQVFISFRKKYSNKQSKEGDCSIISEVRGSLHQLGFSIFPAETDVNSTEDEGPRWAAQVAKAIMGCEVVVVICSPGYGETKSTLSELDLADRYRCKIIPLWLSGCYPPPAVEAYLGSLPRVPKGPLSLASRMEAARRSQGQDYGPAAGRAKAQGLGTGAAPPPARRADRTVLAAVIEDLAALLRRQGCTPRVARPAGVAYLPAVPKNRAAGKPSQAGCLSCRSGSSSSWASVAGVEPPAGDPQANHLRSEKPSEDPGRSDKDEAATGDSVSPRVATSTGVDGDGSDASNLSFPSSSIPPPPPPLPVAAGSAVEGTEETSGSAPMAHAAATSSALNGGESSMEGVSSAQGSMARCINARESSGPIAGASQQDALVKACLAFDIVRIRQLLDSGVSANLADESGWTALHRAAYRSNVVLVEVLLRAGADVGARTRLGDTPLHMASRQHNPLIVRILLEAGADVNSRGQGGATPLHAASSWGRVEVAGELVAAQADKEALDEEGETPYHKAARAGEAAVARLLAQVGANKHAENKAGLTPLDYLAKGFTTYPCAASTSGATALVCTTGGSTLLRASVNGATVFNGPRGNDHHLQDHENGRDHNRERDAGKVQDRTRDISYAGAGGSGGIATLRLPVDTALYGGSQHGKWWEHTAERREGFRGSGGGGDGFSSLPFEKLWAFGGRSTLGRGSPGRVHDGRNRRASTGVLPVLPLLLVPNQASPPRHQAIPQPDQSPSKAKARRSAAATLPSTTRKPALPTLEGSLPAAGGESHASDGGNIGSSGRQSLPALPHRSPDARNRGTVSASPLQAPLTPTLPSPLALPSPSSTPLSHPFTPATAAPHPAIDCNDGPTSSPAGRPLSSVPPPLPQAQPASQPGEGDPQLDPGEESTSPLATVGLHEQSPAEAAIPPGEEEQRQQEGPQDGDDGASEEGAGEDEGCAEELGTNSPEPRAGGSMPASTSSSIREREEREAAMNREEEQKVAQAAQDSVTRLEPSLAASLPPLGPEDGEAAKAQAEQAEGAKATEDPGSDVGPATLEPSGPPPEPQQQEQPLQSEEKKKETSEPTTTQDVKADAQAATAVGLDTTVTATDAAAAVDANARLLPPQQSQPRPTVLPLHQDDEVIRLGEDPPAPSAPIPVAAPVVAAAAAVQEEPWDSEPESEDELDPDTDYTLKPHSTIPPPTGPLLFIILSGVADTAAAGEAGSGGSDPAHRHNAVRTAATPVLDAARATAAASGRLRTLRAHGTAVGMPVVASIAGGGGEVTASAILAHSEASHLTMACGRVLPQVATLVDSALASGAIFRSPGWRHLRAAFSAPHTVHFLGLLSDGGVHSYVRHLMALLRGAAARGATRLRVHVLLDGRDVPDGSSVTYVDDLEGELAALRAAGCDARVASGGGRMRVTMDRNQTDWSVVKRGWDAHVLGQAPHKFTDPLKAVIQLRGSEAAPVSDQHLEPFVIVEADEDDFDDYDEDSDYAAADDDDDEEGSSSASGSSRSGSGHRGRRRRRGGGGGGGGASGGRGGLPVGRIEDGDGVVLFNFRADRMVQFAAALEAPEGQFEGFERGRVPKDLRVVGLTRYDQATRLPEHVLVRPPSGRGQHVVGRYLAASGVRSLAAAEAASAGHVTFYWNGARSGVLHDSLDERFVEPSDRYEAGRVPAPKAAQVAAGVREALQGGQHRLIRVLLPDPDLAAHTGDLPATVRAMEAVDKAVGELLAAVDSVNGRWMLTSDHGNADDMVQRDVWGCPLYDDDMRPLSNPGHTNAPVPFLIGGAGLPDRVRLRKDMPEGGLANLAATMVNLLGFEAPELYEPTLVVV